MSADTKPVATNRSHHRWRFVRAGGFDQVRLDRGADFLNLDQLDQKLWVALSCPTRGLEFDNRTLDLIDTDRDGRIRVPEIIAAVRWAGSMLKNADDLVKGSSSLPLSAINDETPEGKQLLASAKQILVNLGKGDASGINLDDTTDTARIFAQTRFNGDGIVPADAADDPETRMVISEIIACLGPEADRSGKPGVSQARVDQFFADARAYAEWWSRAEADPASLLPLGEQTATAAAAFHAVKTKVDDYFARCRLAAFDCRALDALNRQESDYLAVAAKEISSTAQEVAAFPLARVEAERPLPLQEGVNPAWAGAVARLRATVVKPLLGDKTSLTIDEWALLTSKFDAYDAWMAAKAGAAVEPLGLTRLREILAGKTQDTIAALIARDRALEPEANDIAAVEKLVRYCRDLNHLLNNFVSFRDFYTRKAKAIFQVGTLYLDARSCELCVRVEDVGKHASLAGLAKTYLAYCECSRLATGEKMSIAAAFTGGDSDNLMVGRNGVFYDRRGHDWDATITKIVDNPISIRQAFWSPYKKLVRLIEEQVAKHAAAVEAANTAKLQTVGTVVPAADKTKTTDPKKFDVGTVAALGVAVAGISGVLGGFISGFIALKWWQMPLAAAGMLLVFSLPSVVIAWIKLHQRNLGPILDANGWAINARAKINVPFGGALTAVATLPPGSDRSLIDPYAEKKRPWLAYAVLAAIAAIAALWYFGELDRALPRKLRSSTVFDTNAPPSQPATESPPAPAK